MKNDKARGLIKLCALLLSVILSSSQLAGCGAERAFEAHALITGGVLLPVQKGRMRLAESWERPVNFAFRELEPYTLMLAFSGEKRGEYELRLYDAGGRLLQRVPCGRLTEPIQFDNDFGWSRYLGIFSADSPAGLFYAWENERFSEEPVEVPRYAQSRGMTVLTAAKEDAGCRVKELYSFNYGKERMERLRSWKLREDTGFLEIWDYPHNRSLFSGAVLLDEAGEPVNREYYDMLLWENPYALWDDPEAESTVPTGVWDSDGQLLSQEEYESREALLAAYGFADSSPIYKYYDGYQNLQLELYRNEDTGEFCGIVYSYSFNCDWEERVSMSGFSVRGAKAQEWDGGWQDYSVVDEGGYNGSDAVENYEEIMEYTPDGRPDYFKSQGIMEWEEGYEELTTLLEVNYVYRDDGTLFYREYHHNQRIFYTTLSNLNSFFDESGRPVYESGYITHGRLEQYYVYAEEGDKPVYGIFLDYNPEGIFAQAAQYVQ